ncbi:hypothetical protein VPH35_056682 [Triticum aestivum]|uniref:Uncharacterized protein n=1 Tax=Triticum aestivum TaxID=4565 RepID=A0A3B6FZI1_WHEAT|nr:putative disease resistance protein RGA3 [Triticum aestivum]
MVAVLDAFAAKLAIILVGMAKTELEMLLGVPGEITKLEATLGDLSRITADAERRRIHNPDSGAEEWVGELKDVMYDADNILDLCQIMEGEDASKAPSGCWNIPMLLCFHNPVAAHKIGKKIQALNQRLLDIEKRSTRYAFISQAINSSASNSIDRVDSSFIKSNRTTGSGIILSDVVGEKIKEDTRKLVDILVNKEEIRAGSSSDRFPVVASTGAGGIGKTTLARMVFNDTMVKDHFHKRIWLSVNNNKEVNEMTVLRTVSYAVGGNQSDLPDNKAQLESALNLAVKQKKLLLVMDDVWSPKVWNELLRVPLNDGASGSWVLVTTRNIEVANMMKAHHLHRVDKLVGEDVWNLLKKQVVLNDNDESLVEGLKDIGMEIIERCDGLPLAVKVVGGLLLSKGKTRGDWLDVCSNVAWSMTTISDDVNQAVYVSYEELPQVLKQCLLYYSLFPKDVLIKSADIVNMWIAEGFIHITSMKQPEDLGAEYYKQLVSRNLLDPDYRFYDQKACTMHDVIRSFSQSVVKHEGLFVEEGHNPSFTSGTSKLRHLSISKNVTEWGAFHKQASLRTLILFESPRVDLKGFWNNLSLLRVLSLQGVNVVELPDSISNLRHLRYLGLAGTSISGIPQGIGDLMFMQFIELADCVKISHVPDSILKLRKLRYINFAGTNIASIPRGFGKLEDLVMISGFPTHSDDNTDQVWSSLEELGPLSRLTMLVIESLEKASSGSVAARAKLSSKAHLRILNLGFTQNREVEEQNNGEQERIEEVLGNLCPPTCIEQLAIIGYFGHKLPQWMRMVPVFTFLKRLELSSYACYELPSGLGQLPSLDYFWVDQAPFIKYIGHGLHMPSIGGRDIGLDKTLSGGAAVVAFPKLRKLGFQGMLGLTEWEWEQQIPAMTTLEVLTIVNCQLKYLPPGLAHHANALRELDLRNLSHLVSIHNFPSLVELRIVDNRTLERIYNNPNLQHIYIVSCPGLKVLEDLPSLKSIEWVDVTAQVLPDYFRHSKLEKLIVQCYISLLKLISLQDANSSESEWGKIQHVHQLKATGYISAEETRYISYTKEPYSYKTDIERLDEFVNVVVE